MNLTLAYLRRSSFTTGPTGLAIALAPNLRRDRVAFEGTLADPLRFREAIGTLHDVVISDLRFKKKDKSAYHAYLAQIKEREDAIRRGVYKKTKAELLKGAKEPIPAGFPSEFQQQRAKYWRARDDYAGVLRREDPELWRLLVPCDPVITVAPDVLFFECFSSDESSYGCLTVERDAFSSEKHVALGTTNVDYSWALYEHFQRLRSYRETRFLIDPSGFEVKVEQSPDYREEKIDLPASWLRGFMSLQAAMSLPMRKIPLTREGIYNVLTWLIRHKARKSPRALRFELSPSQPVQLVLEPWEERIALHDARYRGEKGEQIRVWGRNRLLVLSRLLPLIERAEVYLLGTGFPSFWVMHMGNMRLTLGLSGWTANDWTSGGSALDQLAPPAEPNHQLIAAVAGTFNRSSALTFRQIAGMLPTAPTPELAASLNRLASMGQLIHDLSEGVYRWRQIMPVAVSLEQLGPENAETVAARALAGTKHVSIQRDRQQPDGTRLLEGKVKGATTELLLDADGTMLRAKCTCSHHYTGGLRKGPCRHLQAIRTTALGRGTRTNLKQWYDLLWN